MLSYCAAWGSKYLILNNKIDDVMCTVVPSGSERISTICTEDRIIGS
jgi:hypothetical protein